MSKYGGICHCLHARGQHLGDEICIADGCECSRFKAKITRASRGLGADVTAVRPASLDAPATDDAKVTLLDVVAEKQEDDESEPSLSDEMIAKGRAAYVDFVTREFRRTAERQWDMYVMFVQGAPLTAIAGKVGKHVATVYEAITRIRGFLKSEYGADTPQAYQRPNTMLEYKRAKARDLLRNSRLTQKQIAAQVGLNQATISKICQQMEAEGEKRGRGLQELSERCRKGHDRSKPENIYVTASGKRLCRQCYNIRMATYRKRRKEREDKAA